MAEEERPRILLVDDTKTNLDVLISALGKHYRLGVALDGPRAVAYAREHRPDLILLDILMPGMDGFEVCRILKEDPATRDIPILFVTAMETPDQKSKGFEAGAVDYIVKPFDLAEVRARVGTHLSLKAAQKALANPGAPPENGPKNGTDDPEAGCREIVGRLERAAAYREGGGRRSVRIAGECCRLLGEAAGLPPETCGILALAGAMRDLGTMGVGDHALSEHQGEGPRNGRDPTASHTEIGAGLLSGSRHALLRAAETIARTHHERWDGKGYPQGLRGEEIPLYGRIAAIGDALDRGIRETGSVGASLAAVGRGRSTRFDPDLVDHLDGLRPRLEIAARRTEGGGTGNET